MPKLRNIQTGEVIEIDPREARLGKMRRRVWAWSNIVEQWRNSEKINIEAKMVTLTYKGVHDWKPNHIRSFMLRVREFMGDNLRAYCWVAELQRRGAIHYHVMLAAPNKIHLPYPDKAGWWPHGRTNIRVVDHFYYVMKYVQKGKNGENSYPHGARIFAVWFPRDNQFATEEYRNWRVSPYPVWLGRELLARNGDLVARPAAGGGWIIDGEVIKSGYTFLGW